MIAVQKFVQKWTVSTKLNLIQSSSFRAKGQVAPTENRYSYRVSVGKYERKRLLSRPKRRSDDNIKEDFKEIVWKRLD
jgi:hypothetical protein